MLAGPGPGTPYLYSINERDIRISVMALLICELSPATRLAINVYQYFWKPIE
jgi:hypothetical protein